MEKILLNHLGEEGFRILKEKKNLEEFNIYGMRFLRLTQEFRNLWRGTIFYENGIIHGYPRIMRVLHLERGIKRYFKDTFYVEEKVDGYNVRLSKIDNMILAFSRGGFVCPFTTDRIDDLVNTDFFRKYPDLIICGEVVGPGNPYNTEVIPYVKDDVIFLAFDIMQKDGTLLDERTKQKILREFNINTVNIWGPYTYDDIDSIKKIVLELNDAEREGIVIKPDGNGKTIKFVTLNSCLRDLEATSHLIGELPSGFFIQRIMRAIFFSYEFGIPLEDEFLLRSGRALYLSSSNALVNVSKGEHVMERFSIKMKKKENIDALIRHLGRGGVRIKVSSIEREGDYHRVTFFKIYNKATKEFRQKLRGKGFFD